MGAEIIGHDDIILLERWRKDLRNIGLDRIAVHRIIVEAWRGKRVRAQAGHEGGRPPVSVRDLAERAP